MTSSATAILVVNCWDDANKGDAAITIGTLNALRGNEAAERLQVSAYAAHPNVEQMNHAFRHVRQAHPQVEIIPCDFPALSRSIGRFRALGRFVRSALKLLLPNAMSDSALDNAVRGADLVVSNGGLYFGFRPSSAFNMLYHLFAFSYPMMLARRMGTPYILFAQSFGPFPSRLSRIWVRKLVNHSDGAWCRESLSAKLLAQIGANEARLKVIPDAAWGISQAENGPLSNIPLRGLASGEYIVLSLRSLVPAGFPEEVERRYIDSFCSAIQWAVTSRKLTVLLVAHTLGPIEDEDDRTITRAVYQALPPEDAEKVVLCELDLSPQQLCTLYGHAKLVVATRFHAVLLALRGGSPVLAIPYFGVKTQGALSDLGLSSSLMDARDVAPDSLRMRIETLLHTAPAARLEISVLAERLHAESMRSGAMLKLAARRVAVAVPGHEQQAEAS